MLRCQSVLRSLACSAGRPRHLALSPALAFKPATLQSLQYRFASTVTALDPNDLGALRNIGISAHIDSGKTTLTERILFYTGKIEAMHEVRGGDDVGATMDSMELEKEKGITIKSAATYTSWNDLHINIIDTPGHVDFTIEVERSLKVMDGAIMIMCAVSGVQSQTLTVDRQMKRYKVPRLAFINKLDRLGSRPVDLVPQLREQLGLNPVLMQLPIGLEEFFTAIIDLVEKKAVHFEGKDGMEVVYKDIPAEMLDEVEKRREQLIEAVIDYDSQLADMYLEGEDIDVPTLKSAIRRATIARDIVPVFMGSAFKNKGVQLLLDAVVDYLPDPRHRINYAYDMTKFDIHSDQEPPEDALVPLQTNPSAPFVGLAFKITESRFGQLTWMRIYQGSIKKGQTIMNLNAKSKVRVPRLARMHSEKLENIDTIGAGDICALYGVDCSSGDAFADKEANLAMSKMYVPDPVVAVGVIMKEKGKMEALLKVLGRYTREDPTFKFSIDQESGQVQISGMGELHLEIYKERLKREENLDISTTKPYVNYRETIREQTRFDYTFKRQTGGSGQYAKIAGYMEPLPEDYPEKFEFQNEIVGQVLSPAFVAATKKGFEEACVRGPLIGNPVWGIRFVLEDGGFHQVDSNELAFKICASKAFHEAFAKAMGTLLQPMMNVEVMTPSSGIQAVMSSLQSRGGRITSTGASGPSLSTCTAEVPLAEMFGYTAELRSLTQGRGEAAMDYAKHEVMEDHMLPAVLAEYGRKAPSDDATSSGGKGKKK